MTNVIPFPSRRHEAEGTMPFRTGDRLLLKRGARDCVAVTIVDTWMRGVYAENRTYMARGDDGTMYLTTGDHLCPAMPEAMTP